MATLYVTEHSGAAPGIVQVAEMPKLATNNVAITAGSVQSNAFTPNTSLIRVHCDAICSVEIGGTSPTATSASQRMPADAVEYFFVRPGDKLAVITNT